MCLWGSNDVSNSDDDVSGSKLLADEDILFYLKKKKKKKRKKKKIPKELKEKIGKANILFVQKRYEEAINSLKDVLFVNPDIQEAYQTLGLIYEEIGNEEKAIECCSIANRLKPSFEKWVLLTKRALENKMIKEAILFLSKAIKMNPGDNELIWKRSMLWFDLKRYDFALRGLLILLKREPENEKFVEEFYNVSLIINPSNETIKVFETILDTNKETLSFLHLNVLMSLWKKKKKYGNIVNAFKKYSELIVLNMFNKKGDFSITAEQKEREIPSKFRLLYAFSLIKTQEIESSVSQIETMFRLGFPYKETFELVKLLVESDHGKEALSFLNRMDNSIDVLLLRAKCYKQLSSFQKAKDIYINVIQIDKNNEEASVELGRFLIDSGDVYGAISVVSDSHSNLIEKKIKDNICSDSGNEQNTVDRANSNQKSELNILGELVKRKKKIEPVDSLFVENSDVILKYKKVLIYEAGEKTKKNLEEIVSISTSLFSIFFSNKTVLSSKKKILNKRSEKNSSFDIKKDCFLLYGLEFEEWFQLGIIYSQALNSLGWFHKGVCVLNKICNSNLFFLDQRKKKKTLLISLSIYLSNGDLKRVTKMASCFFREYKGFFRDWIFFFLIYKKKMIKKILDSRTQRFIVRTAKKTSNTSHIFMAGSIHVISKNYKSALKQYERIKDKKEPLFYLSFGVTNILLGIKRKTKNKNKKFKDGFVFMFKYYEKRKNLYYIEASYNIGRAFHQIGLYEKSLEYYMNALSESKGSEKYVFECAYNSALILKQTGRKHIAKTLIKKYCTI